MKYVYQCEGELIKKGVLTRGFSGVTDCARYLLKNEGVLGLWRSNLVNSLSQAQKVTMNTQLHRIMVQTPTWEGKEASHAQTGFLNSFFIGGTVSVIVAGSMFPFHYITLRLANDLKSPIHQNPSQREFPRMLDIVQRTWASDGVYGFYRGFSLHFSGIFMYRGLYFGAYGTANQFLKDNALWQRFLVGFGSSLLAGYLTYPLQIIQNRMLMTSANPQGGYKGIMHCTNEIIAREGVPALFKGVTIHLFQGFFTAVALVFYDAAMR